MFLNENYGQETARHMRFFTALYTSAVPAHEIILRIDTMVGDLQHHPHITSAKYSSGVLMKMTICRTGKDGMWLAERLTRVARLNISSQANWKRTSTRTMFQIGYESIGRTYRLDGVSVKSSNGPPRPNILSLGTMQGKLRMLSQTACWLIITPRLLTNRIRTRRYVLAPWDDITSYGNHNAGVTLRTCAKVLWWLTHQPRRDWKRMVVPISHFPLRETIDFERPPGIHKMTFKMTLHRIIVQKV